MRTSVKLSFLAALSLTFVSNFIAIPANVNLFVTSFLTIYVGSHRRLVQMEVRFLSRRRPRFAENKNKIITGSFTFQLQITVRTNFHK